MPGGDVALLRAQNALNDVETADDDERIGAGILRRAWRGLGRVEISAPGPR